MPEDKPKPLNENERALIAEAVDSFWKINVHAYRASTPPAFQVGLRIMKAWRSIFVAQMTTILETFINKVHDEQHNQN